VRSAQNSQKGENVKQSNSPIERTPEQKREILAKIAEYMRDGLTTDAAREKVGISHSQYYSWRKRVGRNSSKSKVARRKRPSPVVNFQIPEATSDQLVILIGHQAHVTQALTHLSQIRGR
jgi:hypothetical protein